MSCAVQVSGGVTLLMLMPIHVVQDERGIALLLTLMATVLLTALGGALITLTTAETAIASNYRNAGRGVLYG
ncbi:MAG: hypothetical protein V3W06_00995 [Acidimicrobiia bacterium]